MHFERGAALARWRAVGGLPEKEFKRATRVASSVLIIFQSVPFLREVLFNPIPVPEFDQVFGLANDRHGEAVGNLSGDPTNDPVVHAYGGNLATRRGPTRSPLDGVSNLDSVERHDGGLHRGGGSKICTG